MNPKITHERLNAYASVLAVFISLVALAFTIREVVRHKATRFTTFGPRVEVRDDFGEIIRARRFEGDGWAIYKTLELPDQDNRADKFAFVLENRAKDSNVLFVVNKSLETVLRYDFVPNCPFPEDSQQAEFRPSFLGTITVGTDFYFSIVFVDENYPSVVDIVKPNARSQTCTSVARLWHQGHLYKTEMLGDLLVCCGKNNTFQLHRGKLPETPEARVTFHHPVVFAVRLPELIRSKQTFGPTGSRKGSEKGFKFEPCSPMAPFAWYYIFDEAVTNWDGFSLDAKVQINQVAFTPPIRWRYFFGQTQLARPAIQLTESTDKAWPALMVLPKDETRELRLPGSFPGGAK